MSKAFTKENDDNEDEEPVVPLPVDSRKNYITPTGYKRLKSELFALMDEERPKVVETVHWAASNGDRSENGDYHYGKKRLREIDRRIRFLTQRLEMAELIEPSVHFGSDQIFLGATVRYTHDDASEHVVTIMGIDEADSARGQISWVSPVASALLKARVGDEVMLKTPSGTRTLTVLAVTYPEAGKTPP
ncbi:MAG: transcription elongation factor GreB [Polaromonas sp.]|nr:transcription elongation factor GreB [Polaromonas sp.]